MVEVLLENRMIEYDKMEAPRIKATDMAITGLTELCIFSIKEIDFTFYYNDKQFMIFPTVVDVKHVLRILVSNTHTKGK